MGKSSGARALRLSGPIVLLLLWQHVGQVVAQVCTKDGKLCDKHERCAAWKEDGECVRSRTYMRKHCPASCESVREEVKEAGIAADQGDCKDMHKHCSLWAKLGECSETDDMLKYCALSCRVCEPDEDEDACKDEHDNCAFWQSHGECEKNPVYMSKNCAKSCGTCELLEVDRELSDSTTENQRVSTKFGTMQTVKGSRSNDTATRLAESIAYMQSDQMTELPEKVRANCQNRNELCTFWAVIGECEKNAAYMKTNCAPACMTCHLIDIEKRCPKLGDDVDPALHPGDLNKMFERILRLAPGNRTLSEVEVQELQESQTPVYTVHVHSRPESVTEISAALDKSMPPWVVTFDNFLTPEECDTLIQLGYDAGYKRSEDVGGQKFDGTVEPVQSERRTSENAWCSQQHGCREQEVPTRIHMRMGAVMGIPPENSEDLQILRYEKGQFYRTHHDYIPHQVDRQCGPRILTFFLYLSDVEEGGGTNFPQLDITIEAKRGRALLWPSVLDSDPMKKDGRMYHQALEVTAGTKFAANGWIHMYDYQKPQKNGCT